MGTLALLAWLTAASASPEAVEVPPEPEAQPAVVEAPDPERWPGEEKRLHWGIGLRGHFGAMVQLGSPQLVAASGLYALMSLRALRHQEFRLQVELHLGIPDLFAGETNLSYRWHLTPRFSTGIGLFGFIGAPSIRYGIEIPVAVRLGQSRRHELGLSVRAAAGVFNNSTFAWYDFNKQRFATTVDATVGYTLLF